MPTPSVDDEEPVIYEIWTKPYVVGGARKVGEARTKQGARNSVDRRDNAYGGYAHTIKVVKK